VKSSQSPSGDCDEAGKALYREIISLDKNNYFRKKEINNDIELVEKGIILKSIK